MHEQLGKGRLEKRLGAWVEPMRIIRVSSAERSYLEREIDDARTARRDARARMRAGLRARYDSDHVRQRREFDAARRQMRSRHHGEYRVLLERHRHRHVRERIRDSALAPTERKAAYSVSAFERARELEALRARQWAERNALTQPQTWREWVEMMARQGDEAAIGQLRGWAYAERRRRKPVQEPDRRNRITGIFGHDLDPLPPTRAQAMENWSWRVDTATGNVGYLRQGERLRWGVVFDSDAAQWDTMLAGLLLARQKFGPRINVSGSEDFRKRTAVLVVAQRLDIMFDDEVLEASRLQLQPASAAQKGSSIMQPQRTAGEPHMPEPKPEPSPDGPEL